MLHVLVMPVLPVLPVLPVADLLCLKGVVAMSGQSLEPGAKDEKLVYQGVHMLFQGDVVGEYAKGEARECRLVFIGRGLDGAALREGVMACVAESE